jgi:hypothetical protein
MTVVYMSSRIDTQTNPPVVLKANGESCVNSSECQGELCGPGGPLVCVLQGIMVCNATNICMTRPVGYCQNSVDCQTGYYCPNEGSSFTAFTPRTCTPKKSAGSACQYGTECINGACVISY